MPSKKSYAVFVRIRLTQGLRPYLLKAIAPKDVRALLLIMRRKSFRSVSRIRVELMALELTGKFDDMSRNYSLKSDSNETFRS